jgi:NAD(P)-dependent dehydrogenase (short-subunit alcohol dehydrogenase family)
MPLRTCSVRCRRALCSSSHPACNQAQVSRAVWIKGRKDSPLARASPISTGRAANDAGNQNGRSEYGATVYRQLAAELGPRGVRVACVRSAGSPDAPGVDEVFRKHAANAGISREAFEAKLAERTLLRRLPRLAEIANVATLLASDRASAMTAAIANVTCGELTD